MQHIRKISRQAAKFFVYNENMEELEGGGLIKANVLQ
jgi:hypothetical protein